MKKNIANLFLAGVLLIGGYLVIANIGQVYSYHHQTEIFTKKGYFSELEKNYAKLTETMVALESLEDVASEEEKGWIQTLKNDVQAINESDIWNLLDGQQLTLKDLASLEVMPKRSDNVKLLRKLQERNPKINYLDVYLADSIHSMYEGNDNFLVPIRSYEYRYFDLISDEIIEPDNYQITTKILSLNDDVVSTEYIAKLVLAELTVEDGELNEK